MATKTLTDTKTDRMHFRMSPDVKQKVEKAALLSGQTLTDFAVSVLAQSADAILERHYATTLSDRDRDLFLEMLDNPPAPNAALRRAAERYRRLTQE
jgi:uncharacterized protein (DUF1778 family)